MSPTGYSLLILLIALSNAALGSGAAVLLGYGPRVPEFRLAWREWLALLASWWRERKDRRAAIAAQDTAPIERLPRAEEPALTLTPIQFDDPPPLAASDALSLDAALGQLQRDVAAVRGELGDLDERVRTCSSAPTVAVVEECVADLQQTGRRLYQQQSEALVVVQHSDGIPAAELVEEQTEELLASLARFDAWQVDPDNLADDCRRLLAATEQLMQSCDEVGQALSSAATPRGEPTNRVKHPAIGKQQHATNLEPIHGVARVGRA